MKRWLRWLLPAALGVIGGAAVLAWAGVSLNFFLGGAALSAAIAPLLTQYFIQHRWRRISVFTTAIALVWLVAVFDHSITPFEWLAAFVVMLSVMAAEISTVELLESLGIPTVPAATLALLAAIVWATWPVWGSLHLGDAGAPHIVPLHPLFAINGIMPRLGIWTEQPMPYRLTAFGQNVVYRLPTSVLPCAALHGGISVVLNLISRGLRPLVRRDG